MFVGMLFMPESPCWYVFHQHTEQAKQVLKRLRCPDQVMPELQNIVRDYEEHIKSRLGK